jgi:predicted  nucleic acid-binding Zn-ribbon protein
MNPYIKQLVELVEIDKKIDSFEPKIAQIRSALDAKLQEQQALQNKIKEYEEELEDIEVKRQKNELHLAELNEKLKTFDQKSAAIKSEKELKALQLEEEIAKEQIAFANEEIERLEKISEQKKEMIEQAKEQIEQMQEELAALQKSTEEEVAKIEAERMKVFEEKQKLLSTMNQNIIVFYEKIRRWAKNTTVVPVRKQACYGCFMRINDHTYAQVIKGEEITTCPHCGRILYLESQFEDKKEQEEPEESASL